MIDVLKELERNILMLNSNDVSNSSTRYDLLSTLLKGTENNIKILKKDGTKEDYDAEKIKNAVRKASNRALNKLTEEQIDRISQMVFINILGLGKREIEVPEVHNAVESVLENISKEVAESYRNYRNYKQDFVRMLDKVYQESQKIMYIGDKDNANSDSTLVSTKRSLIYNALSKELYKKFFLTKEELQAAKEGYIYIHDISARLNTTNCCLLDVANILKNGFEMGNVRYTEPKTLDVAFDVISDVVMSAAAQQYGGLTVPEVDKILEKYAQKSFEMYVNKYRKICKTEDIAFSQALEDIQRDFEQGFQGWEMKWNTVGSSRGDYPFISVSFGLSKTEFGKMANKAILKVRMNGQGDAEHKKPVLFPKLIFLYDENLHGEGQVLEDVFLAAIECSKKAMYPDYVSLAGDNYVSKIYQKYGKPVSPMGSVDGNEVITYKDNEEVITSTFYEFWNKYSGLYEIKQQNTNNENDVYLEPKNIYILDNNEWVDVKFITKNVCPSWYHITLKNGYELTCTNDHPLQTTRGRILACDLKSDDKIYCLINGLKQAVALNSRLEIDKDNKFGYDVTTSSDKFNVSNICSHNCRSFLSPWYERGGFTPADSDDTPIYEGRGNCGVISLNLPMIYMKAKQECKDFYDVLNYYLELIRNLHKRTIDYLGEMKASINPLAYCEGGFYGGNLKPDDKIKPVLKTFTTSFGITALNELQRLYNGKSITEDGNFALEVMEYIAKRVDEFKAEDGILHSCYASPAESLCGTQVKQFRMKYGIIENVSDKDFMTNSFHCHVSENITPIEKQDFEGRFIDLCKGGQIFFTKFNCNYNTEAFKTIVRRGMKKGFYEGTNLNLSYCEDCGHEELDMKKCPKCGSENITSINRVCGYLGYSRIKGDTRFNQGKMAEVKERVSY